MLPAPANRRVHVAHSSQLDRVSSHGGRFAPGDVATGQETMTTEKRELAKPGVIEIYPVLPLRDIVVFPHMIVPLFVGREKSIRALEEVMKGDRFILLAT